MNKPYCIVSPDYDYTSGGIKVMWGLYGWLLAKGQEVYINRRPQRHTIVIYPEIMHGNPAKGETVIRYILNKPGVMASNGVPGPTSFDPTDKLIYFSKLFGDTNDSLFLPIIDLNTFKNYNRNRTKKAYFIGKGSNTFQHPTNAIEITREMALDQKGLAELLNQCDVLYGYDPVSAMYECARLCGCRVVLIQDIYTKEEWSKYEPGMYGLNWGKDNMDKLYDNFDEFREHYKGMIDKFSKQLDQFIEETQV